MASPADDARAAALVAALTEAEAAREGDVVAMAAMTDDEVAYLGLADTLPDPATDGIGCEADI